MSERLDKPLTVIGPGKTQVDPLDDECPKCGASVGQVCLNGQQRISLHYHRERIEKAKRRAQPHG